MEGKVEQHLHAEHVHAALQREGVDPESQRAVEFTCLMDFVWSKPDTAPLHRPLRLPAAAERMEQVLGLLPLVCSGEGAVVGGGA